jgi:hypothetical protein
VRWERERRLVLTWVIVAHWIGTRVGLEAATDEREGDGERQREDSYVTDGSVERRKTSPLKKMTVIMNRELSWAMMLQVGSSR